MDRVLSMIGIAAKSGNVVSGEFSTEKAVKTGSAFLVIVSEEASENTKKHFTDMTSFYEVPIYFYGDKNQKYIKEQNELIINAINDMKSSKNDIQKSINAITKELNIQLKKTGYMELANKILNENQRNHPED